MTKKFMMLATAAALFVACGSAEEGNMEQPADNTAGQEQLDQVQESTTPETEAPETTPEETPQEGAEQPEGGTENK